MEVLRFSDLLKKASEKASDVLQTLGIRDNAKVIGKDGELVFSKNNVCVHSVSGSEEAKHTPGYLSIVCQNNATTSCTLILQWYPNVCLEKHPGRLDNLSPRIGRNSNQSSQATVKLRHLERNEKLQSNSEAASVEEKGKKLPSPTQVAKGKAEERLAHPLKTSRRYEEGNGTPTTSGEDGEGSSSEEEKSQSSRSSSPYSSANDAEPESTVKTSPDSRTLNTIRSFESINETAEEFAEQHNMMLPDQGSIESSTSEDAKLSHAHLLPEDAETTSDSPYFVADLGRLKVLRLFFSDQQATSGQLVLANHQSQYKIFYFHNGGLDKLANIFDQWNVLRLKTSKPRESSCENEYLHFSVLKPKVGKMELHPEEGLYEKLTWATWRSSMNDDRIVDDELMRKASAIFFYGIEASLRREAWPFLLGIYPWDSTREQREHIRNDLFIEYQNLKKKRLKKSSQPSKTWRAIENSVDKDVVRTDRDKPFFCGENNPNLDIMRNILLNYAVFCPQVGYVQGMSDLVSPLLTVIHEEVDTFWCFTSLMQRTVCIGSTRTKQSFEKNLALLVALLEFMYPELYRYLLTLGHDSMQLLFVHRWLLLWFKREFVTDETMCIWEASWTGYGTSYFHLFVALAIMTLFGDTVIRERMKHDEVLLYFNSLALHMDVNVVLTKARGLLYQFCRKETIPCTLAELCDLQSRSSWDSLNHVRIVCEGTHESADTCPYNETAPQYGA